jgi:hypothetical protein
MQAISWLGERGKLDEPATEDTKGVPVGMSAPIAPSG